MTPNQNDMKSVIMGNSGSGKTWLANRIAEGKKAPIVHLDELFWHPGGFDRKRAANEVAGLVVSARAQPSWIVEGVFGELAEVFLPDADTLIWLDIDWEICHLRLRKRGLESRAHMDRLQSDVGREKLVAWAAAYSIRDDKRSYTGHKLMFDGFQGSKFHLTGERAVSNYISALQ
jgi:adenylate kinase family enzyme